MNDRFERPPLPAGFDDSRARERSADPAGWAFPEDARAAVHGVISARSGDFEKALQEFKTAKTLAPNYQNLDRLIEEAHKLATLK